MNSTQPSIICSEKDCMCDVPISVTIEGLQPKRPYTIHSYAAPSVSNIYECVVKYKSDNTGKIDMETHPALGGCYFGVKPMGIFWSMQSSPMNKISDLRFAKHDVTTPLIVTLEVYDCEIDNVALFNALMKSKQLFKRRVASTTVNRWYMAPGTKRILLTVKEHGIHGVLFVPPGRGLFPAVIHMLGMQPGASDYQASLLSSHGFVTLALAVFGVPGTPQLYLTPHDDWTLQLEYFENAMNFLLNIDQVEKSAGVGVIVRSFSGFIGLAMATFSPGVRCLIHENATMNVRYVKFVYKDLLFTGYDCMIKDPGRSSDGALVGRNMAFSLSGGNGALSIPQSFSISHIPKDLPFQFFNRKDVAFMFIACLSDDNTPSEYNVNRAHKLLKLAKHPNFEILRYPGAGHLLEPSFAPYNDKCFVKLFLGVENKIAWGGKPLPHCRAQEHAWKTRISFLKRNLGKRCNL